MSQASNIPFSLDFPKHNRKGCLLTRIRWQAGTYAGSCGGSDALLVMTTDTRSCDQLCGAARRRFTSARITACAGGRADTGRLKNALV